MAARPGPPAPAPVRAEILKELQALLDDRELRERLDKGPLAETKGREHWILHLLVRAHEIGQAHVANLVGTSYAALAARLQTLEEAIARAEQLNRRLGEEVVGRLDVFERNFTARFGTELGHTLQEGRAQLSADVVGTLDEKWKPVSESIETFARSSHQLTKDVSDTYRVATQTRLLLNENARRMTDLGRDLVALEEGLKLSLAKVVEEAIVPLEERVAALEGRRSAEVAPTARTSSGTGTSD